MKERTIVICHRDKIYSTRLMNYINRKEAGILCAVTFAEQEKAADFLEEHPDAFLLCEEDAADRNLLAKKRPAILLCDISPESESEGHISRFRKAGAIVGAIKSALPEEVKQNAFTERIVGCLDFGACRSDESALNTLLSGTGGQKTLLIAMEPLFKPDGQEKAQEKSQEKAGGQTAESFKDNLSKLLFAVSSGQTADFGKFSEQYMGADCIHGLSFWGDLCEFTTENAGKLAKQLEDSGYERIVLSLCGLYSFTPVILGLCDRIILRNATQADLKEACSRLEFAGFGEIARRLEAC